MFENMTIYFFFISSKMWKEIWGSKQVKTSWIYKDSYKKYLEGKKNIKQTNSQFRKRTVGVVLLH